MFHKPRSLITPAYCTRSLKGVEAKREEEREGGEERVLGEEPPCLADFQDVAPNTFCRGALSSVPCFSHH